MEKWKEIRSTAKSTAGKAVKKTGEIADLASMYVRLKTLEVKRDLQYKQLGKLTYRQMKTGESLATDIAPVIEALDEIRAKIKVLVSEIEAVKAARKAQREAAKTAVTEEIEPSADEDAATEETAE